MTRLMRIRGPGRRLGLTAIAVAVLLGQTAAMGAGEPTGPPQSTLAPSITGTATDGARLTAAPGEWVGEEPMSFAYRWTRCAEACADIDGATGSAYTLTSEDVGARIAVAVTATNAAGSATAGSAPTEVVAAAAPVNITRPNLTGSAVAGEVLTTTVGRWRGTQPMTFANEWRRCDAEGERCETIDGANGDTYRLTALDVGFTIRARVIATNVVGSTMRSSLQSSVVTPVPLSAVSPPAVSGTLEDGARLTAFPGVWEGSGPIVFGYRWLRCDATCESIPGAEGASYTLQSVDVGRTIAVAVTARGPGGELTVESERTGVVTGVAPASLSRPVVSGKPAAGELLSTTIGRWAGTQPMTFEHRWRRCDAAGNGCEVIPGATEASYRVTAEDAGATLRARVIATNVAGATMRSSLQTAVVDAEPPAVVDPPTLGGIAREGLALEVTDGTWTGSPASFEYRWRRCAPGATCTEIADVIGRSYRLTPADVGMQLEVSVVARNAVGVATASTGASETVAIRRVYATAETTPVNISGDAADDVAVWPDRVDPANSLIVATTKAGTGGLSLHGPSGGLIDFWADGKMNNVDLREGFPLDGRSITLVAAGSRSTRGGLYPNGWLALYRLDPGARALVDVAAGVISPGIGTYGSCLYRSPVSGRFFAFVISTDGELEQYELFDDGQGRVAALRVRAFDVGGISEGCVADDERGLLYVAEEDRGIWRFSAEPDGGTERALVDRTGTGGHLVADVEGLALLYEPGGTGYLIASSQGDDTFAVYRREGGNAFVRRFEVAGSGTVDGVTVTDGTDATNASLGPAFPKGAFIAHDDANGAENQNYKLVPLEHVLADEAPNGETP